MHIMSTGLKEEVEDKYTTVIMNASPHMLSGDHNSSGIAVLVLYNQRIQLVVRGGGRTNQYLVKVNERQLTRYPNTLVRRAIIIATKTKQIMASSIFHLYHNILSENTKITR